MCEEYGKILMSLLPPFLTQPLSFSFSLFVDFQNVLQIMVIAKCAHNWRFCYAV